MKTLYDHNKAHNHNKLKPWYNKSPRNLGKIFVSFVSYFRYIGIGLPFLYRHTESNVGQYSVIEKNLTHYTL